MEVTLKHPVFKATQWFKDGDHSAVQTYSHEYIPDTHCITTVYQQDNEDIADIQVRPGDWIVEMPDGTHLYDDEEFHELFREYMQGEQTKE